MTLDGITLKKSGNNSNASDKGRSTEEEFESSGQAVVIAGGVEVGDILYIFCSLLLMILMLFSSHHHHCYLISHLLIPANRCCRK